jgi:hypothetical protein
MRDATYRSRIDAWLVIIVVAGVAVALMQAVLLHERAPVAALVALGVAIFTVAVVMVMTLPCRYELQSDHLLIRCGLIRQRIAYADITGIAPSRSMVAAPALSLRRVKISFRHGEQLVSPREREDFIAALMKRAPALT